MGGAKRKTYTASFKAKVGLEGIRGVKTANEIGQEHGDHPVQVGRKKEILEQAGTLFETQRGRQKVDEQAGPDLRNSLNSAENCPGHGVHFSRTPHAARRTPLFVTDAALDTGGWLALTRPGPAPGKNAPSFAWRTND